MDAEKIIATIVKCGLKVTPQRITVLDAVIILKNHPTAENIIDYIKTNHPNIATGTVYKTLDTFISCGIIKKVKTDSDIMRYDSVISRHHHLYCAESDRIEDFVDETLDKIIGNYLESKKIPNFKIDDIKLQLVGKFTDHKNSDKSK
jgi:Fur family transcriptional regulator, peroxide stress response regulator